MLYVTPLSNENEVIETGPAVQVNAVKFPSKSALTNIYKVGWRGGWGQWHVGGTLALSQLGHRVGSSTLCVKVGSPGQATCGFCLTIEGNVRSTFSWHPVSLVVSTEPRESRGVIPE